MRQGIEDDNVPVRAEGIADRVPAGFIGDGRPRLRDQPTGQAWFYRIADLLVDRRGRGWLNPEGEPQQPEFYVDATTGKYGAEPPVVKVLRAAEDRFIVLLRPSYLVGKTWPAQQEIPPDWFPVEGFDVRTD